MKKVALVVPNFEGSGGVKTVANFIKDSLLRNDYEVQLFSLAVSYKDPNSKLLFKPNTWFNKELLAISNRNSKIIKVGAKYPEIEVNRYKPRKELTRELNKFDIVQIVAGTPAWANVCRNLTTPLALQIATLTKIERNKKLNKASGVLGSWKKYMTQRVSDLDVKGLRVADAIMVENYWMEEYLYEMGYEDKTYFAPPGIDIDQFKPKKNEEGERVLDSTYLLSVGRFSDPRKDIPTLFRAYKKLKEGNKDTPELVLAGKSMPGEEDLKLARSLGIFDDILLKKDISLDHLVTLYQNAEVFVLSSQEEGLGIVIMEAMACGTAVVSTDCGGPSTLIKDGYNGYLCEVGNAEQLANKTMKVLDNTDLKSRFICRSLSKIREDFSLEKAIAKYKSVYDRL